MLRLAWVFVMVVVVVVVQGQGQGKAYATIKSLNPSGKVGGSSSAASKKVLCYYNLPCHGQRFPPPLPVTSLEPDLCTHIVISSAVIHNDTILPCVPQHSLVYKEVVSLKKQHPDLQVVVSVEGDWTALTSDPMTVAVFAYNAKQFLQNFGLDGLEVVWQPPAWPSWGDYTVHHLSILLLQLNNALQLASRPPFLLSLAVSASQNLIDRAYDIRTLNRTVDYISVATYDFHTYHSKLPFTGHGAPLRPWKAEKGYWATLNVQWTLMYWLRKGLPREKLVITIPTHANTWTLLSSSWTGVGAPAVGLGQMDGHMTYPQVCEFVDKGSAWQWDKASRVPYAWRSRDWMSYEDEASVKEKVQLVAREGLAGVAILHLNSDDWAGVCPGNTTFPLLRAVKDVLTS